jgi:hypothetical protein
MIRVDGRAHERRLREPTSESTWQEMAGSPITDELLEWPPDVFALVNVILERSEAFRFVLSPRGAWPPDRVRNWPEAVERAARRWSAWVEDRRGAVPDLLADEWSAFRERAGLPLERVSDGRDWRMCEALLTLHAIADEACAGLAIALDSSDGRAPVYRARGRELLVRTGSMARINPLCLRVLPKVRTPPTGRASFSRYACVHGPGINACWHKIPGRHRGVDPRSEYANLLLLPWPLRVRASDFRPVEGPVERVWNEPHSFFEFAPDEGLDLDLLDRVLVAARGEAGNVDVVILPESAVDENEIEGVEALLDRHGVTFVHAGVRERSPESGRFPGNWMHIGVAPRLAKGEPGLSAEAVPWFHIRQNKHHRWSLDEGQIYQYHLGGALHPRIRWFEAMDVPRREIQFVEVAELTLVSLICEDLAEYDDLARLIRSVGPTVVATVLLDGPQLSSRWSARYASVLADDPGCAVLTLTSYGMVQRSRPQGRAASSVVALWKDPMSGTREIPLEAGAHGVLLTVCMGRATRRSADGRWPVENGTHAFDAAVHQITAASAGSGSWTPGRQMAASRVLEMDELTVLTAWAEGLAEALAYAPERTSDLLAEALPRADWRAAVGLEEPSARLAEAINSLARVVSTAAPDGDPPTFDEMLTIAGRDPPGEPALDRIVRRALLSMLEERRTRQPAEADRPTRPEPPAAASRDA